MCPLGFSPRFFQGENICLSLQRLVLPYSQLYNRQEKAVYKFFKKISISESALGYLGEVFQENCYYKKNKSLGSLLLDPTPHSDINILGASAILVAYLK